MDLKNSTILITGGSSGIGLEMVKQLTQEGATLIITGRNVDTLNSAKAQYPNVHTFQSDVSKPSDIEQLYNDVIKLFPKLNIIVNNAGAMRLIDLRDSSRDIADLASEIDINLTGTVQMVHRFLPHLLEQPTAAIVNVSSGIAYMPYSAAPIYSATKAGVRAYTRALRLQLQDTGVEVFEMIPPGVNTNLQRDWVIQPKPSQMMDADKMVNIVVKSLKNDTLEIKPLLIKVIGTLSRIAPGMLIRFGHKEFKRFRERSKAV
ncbi:SDR family NAD(P)-dependent oxidoreductase [Olivibacter sp. SDN3]|nr:SDR family NAD(P)-dependent oxidoreductase [Olivibacter sp. SDN3]